jgi:hypothetical protein
MSLARAKYCIDSSCFIDMSIHQPLDIFEGLWKNLLDMVDAGELLIHRLVREEVMRKDDSAAEWMKKVQLESLVDVDEDQSAFITQMATDYKYMAHLFQQREYRLKADPFLVALGAIVGCPVVTNEGKQEWRIPDLCNRYAVVPMNHIDFIREMGWKFR